MLIFHPPEMYKRLRDLEPKYYTTQSLYACSIFSLKYKWLTKPLIYYLSGIFQIIEYGYFQSKFFTSNYRVGKIQKNKKWLEDLQLERTQWTHILFKSKCFIFYAIKSKSHKTNEAYNLTQKCPLTYNKKQIATYPKWMTINWFTLVNIVITTFD